MKRILKIVLINILVFVVFFELVSFIYIKFITPAQWANDRKPTYLEFSLDNQYDTLRNPISPGAIDTAYTWCTWHPRNRIHRLVSKCFNVICKYNALGTRGALPDSTDPNTIFFVGDSFAEGYGLDEDSTVPERVRRRLNTPVLNLGMSGHIGTTQMSLIYAEFAKQFTHRDVYVLCYLENDFLDNDINSHEKYFKNRFRPYRIFNNDGSPEIVYKGSMDSSSFSWEQFNREKNTGFSSLKRYGLRQFLFGPESHFFSNLIKMTYSKKFGTYLSKTWFPDEPKTAQRPSELTYDSTSWKILMTDFESILATAKAHHARVTVINLPSRNLLTASNQDASVSADYTKLENRLREFFGQRNARYLSFTDEISQRKIPLNELFFPCDGHYSNYGAGILTNFIANTYTKN